MGRASRPHLPALEGSKQAAWMLSLAARGAACWLAAAAVVLTLFAAFSDLALAGGHSRRRHDPPATSR